MKFKKMKLSELHPAEYNPRVELKPGMEEYEKLKQSILEFGFVDPPIFNKRTGNLVGGHQRVSVAKDLGIGEIEVSIVDLPIEKEKALNIALNKISGQWDEDKLALLLNELDENELNISGFTDKEIQEVIDQYDMRLDLETEAIDDGFEFELPEKPKAALGDIYQLGRHRLMCGDSTNKAHIELLMDGEKADLLITDPPYSAFSSTYDNLKEGASFYVWYASSEVINFVNSLVDSQFMMKQELIWLKNSFVLGRQDYHWQHEPCLYGWKKDGSHRWYGDRKQTTVLDFDKPIANKEHPTMKPIPLFDYQIKNSSKKGDKILDIFGGSGTTMIACEQNDRQAYLMELDPKYVDVIINRWEEFTGKEAIKLN
ncbi:DNA modification methylase [Enterococcus faecalis]|nr:DNA modification methylase [Enterococcus faecalis]